MSRGETLVKLVESFVELVKLLLPAFLAWQLPPPKKADPHKEEGQGSD